MRKFRNVSQRLQLVLGWDGTENCASNANNVNMDVIDVNINVNDVNVDAVDAILVSLMQH